MKKASAGLLLVLLCTACSMNDLPPGAPGGVAVDSDATKRTLLRINREIIESLTLKNDPSRLLQHAHENFLVVAPGGRVENLQQAAAGAASFNASAVSISDEQVTIVGTTAVVVGKLQMDGEMRPVGRLPATKFMAVFVKQGSEWKLLGRALTPCSQLAIDRGVC